MSMRKTVLASIVAATLGSAATAAPRAFENKITEQPETTQARLFLTIVSG